MSLSVEEIMKMYEQGGSKNKDKLVKMLQKNVEEALDKGFHSGMSYGILYETLTKEKAILEMATGKEDQSTDSFLESTGVSARQEFCSRENQSKYPNLDDPKKGGKVSSNQPSVLDVNLINFKKSNHFKQKLADLHSDYTVVQISEIYPGQRQFPPEVKARPLRLARFGCGTNEDQLVQKVAKPHSLPAARDMDILDELKSVIKDHVTLVSTLAKVYYKQSKLLLEERFQTVLEAIRDWLGPWRCLLLGNIADQKLNKLIAQKVKNLVKELEIDEKQALKLSLLTQCSNVFSKIELVQALESFAPNKADLILNAVKKMKEIATELIGAGLPELNAINRHPVILIVDKTLFIVPWEQLDVIQTQPMSRMPSLTLTHALYLAPGSQRRLNSNSTYFVVDPDENLPATARRLKPILDSRSNWEGIISSKPEKEQLLKKLQESDMYLYSGHGSGSHLIPIDQDLKLNATTVLLGCSSADINRHGVHWEMYGAPLSFLLSGSPLTLGMLWIVTDTDTDKMTVRLIETLPPKNDDPKYKLELCKIDTSFAKCFEQVKTQPEILKALRSAQTASTSKIIASAFIAFGLPVYISGSK